MERATAAAVKRMLVPTDFGGVSELACRYAMHMAGQQGSTVHLLHVVDDTSVASAHPDSYSAALPSLRARLVEEATARLREVAVRCAAGGVRVTTEVAVGRPARVIADTAMRRGTDLIVMGTHGRSGLAHLMVGSVAERVVRVAPCAVLTVRDTARVADAVSRFAPGEPRLPPPSA